MSKFIFVGRTGCQAREVADSGAAIKLPTKIEKWISDTKTAWFEPAGVAEYELFLCETVCLYGVNFQVFCSQCSSVSQRIVLEKLLNHLPNTFPGGWRRVTSAYEKNYRFPYSLRNN